MASPPKILIEASQDNPGRLTLLDSAGKPGRRLPLAPLAHDDLVGLANELCDRGFEVEVRATDVEQEPAALAAHAALRALGLEAPYPAYDETIALERRRRDSAGEFGPTE